jgi:hypothetical protein
MDNQLSTQPAEHYSDLIAQLNDPAWLKQNAEIKGDGWVEAGNEWITALCGLSQAAL